MFSRGVTGNEWTTGSRARLHKVSAKHSILFETITDIKSSCCGENSLCSLHGDGIVNSSTIQSIWLLVGIPKGKRHTGCKECGRKADAGIDVSYKDGQHAGGARKVCLRAGRYVGEQRESQEENKDVQRKQHSLNRFVIICQIYVARVSGELV